MQKIVDFSLRWFIVASAGNAAKHASSSHLAASHSYFTCSPTMGCLCKHTTSYLSKLISLCANGVKCGHTNEHVSPLLSAETTQPLHMLMVKTL